MDFGDITVRIGNYYYHWEGWQALAIALVFLSCCCYWAYRIVRP